MRPLIAIAAAIAVTACSPGDGREAGAAETKTWPITDFTSLKAETGVRIILQQGPYAVEAKSENGDLSRLSIEQRDFTLEVGSSGMFTVGRSPTYTVTLTAPEWTAIEASAGASVEGEGLKLAAFTIDASSGAGIDLSGECATLTASAAAGGSIEASDLRCVTVTADGLAGGSVHVFASETATATATAGGSVEVSGNPANFTKTATAGGSVGP